MKVLIKFGNCKHVLWMDTTYYGTVSDVTGMTWEYKKRFLRWYWKCQINVFGFVITPIKTIKDLWRYIRLPSDFSIPTGTSQFNQYAMMRAIRLWLDIGCSDIQISWNGDGSDPEDWRDFVEQWDKSKDPPSWYKEWRVKEMWTDLGFPRFKWDWEGKKEIKKRNGDV